MQARTILRIFFGLVSLLYASSAMMAQAQGGPASVFAHPVETVTFSNRIEALGTLTANERVELTVNVSDRVTRVYFDDGQRVKAGDTLLSLLQGQQAAQVEAALAKKEEAQASVERMRPLVEEGAVSRITYDQALRDLRVAESELIELRIEKNERVLVAPFDGVLGFRQVSVGTYLKSGDVVTTLIDDSVMKLDFDLPSIYISQIAPGVTIEATTEDFPGEVFSGTINSIDNEIDPVTRAVTVRAILTNEELKLRPGTLMSVVVHAAPSDALAVREEAIQPRGPKTFVFTIEEEGGKQIARRHEVQLGRRQGGHVEVLSGLEEGDLVITEGIIRTRDGGPVIVRDESLLISGGGGAGMAENGVRGQ